MTGGARHRVGCRVESVGRRGPAVPAAVSAERGPVAVDRDPGPRPAVGQPTALDEFARRYRAELDRNPAAAQFRESLRQHRRVPLVYAARDPHVNHAAVLRDYLRPHDGRKE